MTSFFVRWRCKRLSVSNQCYISRFTLEHPEMCRKRARWMEINNNARKRGFVQIFTKREGKLDYEKQKQLHVELHQYCVTKIELHQYCVTKTCGNSLIPFVMCSNFWKFWYSLQLLCRHAYLSYIHVCLDLSLLWRASALGRPSSNPKCIISGYQYIP